jgi:hypothetical protein
MKRVTNATTPQSKSKINRCHTTKCGCRFNLQSIQRHQDDFYLKKHGKNNLPAHTNHIWIDPFHKYQGKQNLNQQVKRVIMDHALSGVTISNITIYIRKRFKINVECKTIYNLRSEHIQELLDSYMGNSTGNSVDKLIALFQNTKKCHFSTFYTSTIQVL